MVTDGKYEIAITNKPNGNNATITVKKEWDDGILDHSDYTVKAQLYKKTEGEPEKIGEEVTLKQVNDTLSYTWTIPEGSDEYYVVETVVKKGELDVLGSYTVTYSNDLSETTTSDASSASVTEGTITIKNTGEPTNISVKKKWVSAADVEKTDTTKLPNIKVKLYKKEENGSQQLVEEKELGSQYASTENYSDGGWKYNWRDLPEGTYYVEEVSTPTGYAKVTYQLEVTEGTQETSSSENASEIVAEEGTIVVTNHEDSTGLKVEKKWGDNISAGKPDVKVRLYRTIRPLEPTIVDPTPTPKPTATPTATPTPEPTATPVPTATPTPKPTATPVPTATPTPKPTATPVPTATPTPKPTATPVPTATPTPKPTATPTPTAEPTGEPTPTDKKFTIEVKEWHDSWWQVNTMPDLGKDAFVEVNIYANSDSTQPINDTPIRLTAPDWRAEFTYPSASDGEYYYTKQVGYSNNITGVHDGGCNGPGILGITVIYDHNILEQKAQSIDLEFNGSSEIYAVARNNVISEPVTFNASTTTSPIDSEGNLTLTIDGREFRTSGAEYMGEDMDRTLSHSSDFTASWTNLDKTDANGNLYYYYAVEEPVEGYIADYQITYKDGSIPNGTDKVVITNTEDENRTSVTVTKNWTGDLVDGASYEANITLYNSDGTTANVTDSTVTLNGMTASYTWSNLPQGTYYVKENWAQCNGTEVSNCTTTYRVGNGEEITSSSDAVTTGGTIIITNKVTKSGIILPGTGSKYPLVFYGLGSAFLLISTVWMLLTLKKRNTLIDAGKGGKRSNTK